MQKTDGRLKLYEKNRTMGINRTGRSAKDYDIIDPFEDMFQFHGVIVYQVEHLLDTLGFHWRSKNLPPQHD